MRGVKLAAFPAVRTGLAVAAVLALAWQSTPAESHLRAPAPMFAAASETRLAPEQYVAEQLNAADRQLLLDAHRAADRNDWTSARALARRSTHDVARRTITWRYLLDESTSPSFKELNAFIDEHPNWPRHDAMIRRAEASMPRSFSAEQVIAWYASRPPLGKTGMMRLGQALIDVGKEEDGRELLRKSWVEHYFTEAGELNFLELYASRLKQSEQVERFERLLAQGKYADAQRQAKRLAGVERSVAQTRLAMRRAPEKALRQHAKVPAAVRQDPRYRFEYARILRRNGRAEEALQLMAQLPAQTRVDPVTSWNERQTLARQAIELQRPALAYALASRHALLRGPEFAEAEFLSGWIAFTRLGAEENALQHFQRAAEVVTKPISRARAQYWIGRTRDALNHTAHAHEAYAKAAKHHATFYGQLARAELDQGTLLRLAAAHEEVISTPRDLRNDERAQALSALESLGQAKLVQAFAAHLAGEFEDAASLQLVADIVARSGNRKNALRIAKIAAQKDVVILSHSAPVLDLPEAGVTVEKALVLGLTRQESEFDPEARSPVGASGLMQLMPGTAKEVARSLKMTFSPAEVTDPETNLRLGSAYLGGLLKRWSGSYILAIASYNAGPGNVRKWLRLYGDPRTPQVDPVAWIEAIPFAETRNYVQRVLENTHLYRTRLAAAEPKLMLAADLERGSEPEFTPKFSIAIAP